MLELAWAELSEVSKRIEYLQGQRFAMRIGAGLKQTRPIAGEIERAISERERVVARIANLMQAGALDEPERGYRRAA
jgi:hypothetical protein